MTVFVQAKVYRNRGSPPSSVLCCVLINTFSYLVKAEIDQKTFNTPAGAQLCFQARTLPDYGYHHPANRQFKTRKSPLVINTYFVGMRSVCRMAKDYPVDFQDLPQCTRTSPSQNDFPLDRLGEDNLLPDRRQRLERAVQGRMQGLRVVLDGVGDPRNRAAV